MGANGKYTFLGCNLILMSLFFYRKTGKGPRSVCVLGCLNGNGCTCSRHIGAESWLPISLSITITIIVIVIANNPSDFTLLRLLYGCDPSWLDTLTLTLTLTLLCQVMLDARDMTNNSSFWNCVLFIVLFYSHGSSFTPAVLKVEPGHEIIFHKLLGFFFNNFS